MSSKKFRALVKNPIDVVSFAFLESSTENITSFEQFKELKDERSKLGISNDLHDEYIGNKLL